MAAIPYVYMCADCGNKRFECDYTVPHKTNKTNKTNMTHLTDVIEEQKKVLKAWNKDVFTDQEFADILEEGMNKAVLSVIKEIAMEAELSKQPFKVSENHELREAFNSGIEVTQRLIGNVEYNLKTTLTTPKE